MKVKVNYDPNWNSAEIDQTVQKQYLLINLNCSNSLGNHESDSANESQKEPVCVSMIKMRNTNKIQNLYVGRLTDTHLEKQQLQVFRYEHRNVDTANSDITKIEIHLKVISGEVVYLTDRKFTEVLTSNFQNENTIDDYERIQFE